MKRRILERWTAGNGSVFLYTEDRETAQALKQQLGKRAMTYQRRTRVFGWQFLIASNTLPFVEKKIHEKFSAENQ